jgi:two-component system, sensor histidine kinase and response regulator
MPAASAAVNILLVDDKPENLLALEELLKQPDRRLVKAESGNAALRLLLKDDFAVVLLDVEMPEMDGYEVAQLIRSAEHKRGLPIIFVTAGDRSEQRTFRGYEAGAVDFLYKPLDAHTLRSKVDVFVELYRKTRDLALANAVLERTAAALSDKIADLENVSHTLSHDLRAPLRSIRVFSEALAESLEGKLDPEQRQVLEYVRRGGDRMAAMLDELFALLRVGAENTPHDAVDITGVLAGVIEGLRGDIDRCAARITYEQLPTVHANRMLVGQILQNLISNALKFHGAEAPEIHVSAHRGAHWWELAVTDNGLGIPEEDRVRVFRMYERIGDDSSGAGVGLALCKRAVEKLGGRIWIEPVVPAGTTFRFTIPCAADPSREPRS